MPSLEASHSTFVMLRLRNVSVLSRSLKTVATSQQPATVQQTRKNAPVKSARVEPHTPAKLTPWQHIPRQRSMEGCRELTDVERLFAEYEKTKNFENPAITLSLVWAVLETCRTRGKVFRQHFEREKRKIFLKQDERLWEILSQVISDLKTGDATLSSYGAVFLFTALARVQRADEIEKTWLMFCQRAKECPVTAELVQSPYVVAAALNHCPQDTLSLDFVQETYDNAVQASGPNIHLDEALIRGLISTSTPEAVTEKFAQIVETWAGQSTMRAIDRIYNRVLTDMDSLEVSEAFFEMGMAGGVPSYVHPGAVAAYIDRLARRTLDIEKINQVLKRTVSYYAEHYPGKAIDDYGVIFNSWRKAVSARFPDDTQSGRQLILSAVEHVDSLLQHQRFLCNCITLVNDQWPDSDFRAELVNLMMSKHSKLAPSTCRVLLNAQPGKDTVEKLWQARVQAREKLQVYDIMALIRSVDTAEVAQVVAPLIGNAVKNLDDRGRLDAKDLVVKSILLLPEIEKVAPWVI